MIEIIEDLRRGVTESDIKQMASVYSKIKGYDVTANKMKQEINSSGAGNSDIRNFIKYYLTFNQFRRHFLDNIKNVHFTDPASFKYSLKEAERLVDDHINNLGTSSWYV